jgi:hypothetical protein
MRSATVGFILALHLPAAVAWLWLMPRGWPISSARFWVNEIAPIAIFIAAAIALVALVRRRDRLLLSFALPLICLWLSASIAALFVFPRSGWLITIRLGPLAILMLATLLPFRKSLTRRHIAAIVIGLMIGPFITLAERAPRPDTRPLNISPPTVVNDASDHPVSFPIGDIARFSVRSGDVHVTADRLLIEITPLLTFTSCSPDGGWINFASPTDRTPPRRTLEKFSKQMNEAIATYQPGGTIRLATIEPDHALDIDASTTLMQPTYSHLNTFCEISIAGHKRLAIAFSPCPNSKIDVSYYDYPFGRPATFACLGEDGIFRVLRATNSEKGPFTTIASGPLARGAPLSLTLFDQDAPQLRFTFDDWSAQLSTHPSPTAGWGVPVNAIEFSLMYDNPRAPAGIYMTLAATSVGRGFDSVGHAAGTYRNRMHVERCGDIGRRFARAVVSSGRQTFEASPGEFQ